MTVKQAATKIRAHLLKYWETANNWDSYTETRMWPHHQCLVTLKSSDGRQYSRALPGDQIKMSLLSLLNSDRKEGVLAYLDTLILAGIK